MAIGCRDWGMGLRGQHVQVDAAGMKDQGLNRWPKNRTGAKRSTARRRCTSLDLRAHRDRGFGS